MGRPPLPRVPLTTSGAGQRTEDRVTSRRHWYRRREQSVSAGGSRLPVLVTWTWRGGVCLTGCGLTRDRLTGPPPGVRSEMAVGFNMASRGRRFCKAGGKPRTPHRSCVSDLPTPPRGPPDQRGHTVRLGCSRRRVKPVRPS